MWSYGILNARSRMAYANVEYKNDTFGRNQSNIKWVFFFQIVYNKEQNNNIIITGGSWSRGRAWDTGLVFESEFEVFIRGVCLRCSGHLLSFAPFPLLFPPSESDNTQSGLIMLITHWAWKLKTFPYLCHKHRPIYQH